jgi:hypothetical protein
MIFSTHRRLVRGRADLERKAHVDRMGRTDLADQGIGNLANHP